MCIKVPKEMNDPEFEIVLKRKMVVTNKSNASVKECVLEIGFSPGIVNVAPEPAVAAFRIVPFEKWRRVYGEDLIQALELTIRMAYLKADIWGADWPDEDIETPMTDPG